MVTEFNRDWVVGVGNNLQVASDNGDNCFLTVSINLHGQHGPVRLHTLSEYFMVLKIVEAFFSSFFLT